MGIMDKLDVEGKKVDNEPLVARNRVQDKDIDRSNVCRLPTEHRMAAGTGGTSKLITVPSGAVIQGPGSIRSQSQGGTQFRRGQVV
jgi:hypothetical protein